MKKKSIAGLSGQLSRTQMKGIVAGRPPGSGSCPYACYCDGGVRALVDPSYSGSGCSGPVCYCPDGSAIHGDSCPCL